MTTADRMILANERVRRFSGGRLPEWLVLALQGKAVTLEDWQEDFVIAWKARHGEEVPGEKDK